MHMHLETMDVRPAHEMQKLSEAEVQAQREVERQKSEQGGSLWNHVSHVARRVGRCFLLKPLINATLRTRYLGTGAGTNPESSTIPNRVQRI